MESLYQKVNEGIGKIKTIGSKVRNYVLASTLATGLAYNATGQEIYNNIKQEIKNATEQTTKLKQLKTTYQQTIDSATILFNEAIKDKKLTIKEQKEILKQYNQTKTNLYHYNNFAKENNIETITMNDKYFKLIEKNIEDWDWEIPELEKQLKKEGHNIQVQNYLSDREENISILLITMLGLGFLNYKMQKTKFS